MTYQRFEEVARLTEDDLLLLLRQGDAVERVWSAWALGLVRGTSARPDFAAGLSQSPDPGTRSQLIVILAGLGERELIGVLAAGDPDADVRATACQYLLRTRQADDTATEGIVRDLLIADLSPAVRRAILLEEHPRPLPLTEESLVHLVETDNLKVRQVVLAKLLAEAPPSHLFPGVLENRISVEPDSELRQRLVGACLQAGGAERLAALSAILTPPRRREILDALVAHGARLSWSILEPLAALGETDLESVVLQLLDPASDREAWRWLLSISARALEEIASRFQRVAWQARSHLLQAARSRPAPSDWSERQKIGALIAAWQLELTRLEWSSDPANWEEDEDDDYDYDASDSIEALRELIAALKSV